MKTLGIHQVGDNYNIALVEDGKKLLGSATFIKGTVEPKLEELLSELELVVEDIDYVAYTDDSDADLDFINVPSVVVDKDMSKYYSMSVSSLGEAELNYPALIIDDQDTDTSLFILEDIENKKLVSKYKNISLTKLISEIEKELEISDVLAQIEKGDELVHYFRRYDPEKSVDFDFSYLKQEIQDAMQEFEKNKEEMTKEVEEELRKFLNLDLLASFLDALYESLIIYIISIAADLGIANIGLVGNLNDHTRFLEKLIKHAQEANVNIIVPEKEPAVEPAIGIAGLASHYVV